MCDTSSLDSNKRRYDMGATPSGVFRDWKEKFNPQQNAFGYVYGSKCNNKGFLSRTNRMCGLDPRGTFATCGKFVDCFEVSGGRDDALHKDWPP